MGGEVRHLRWRGEGVGVGVGEEEERMPLPPPSLQLQQLNPGASLLLLLLMMRGTLLMTFRQHRGRRWLGDQGGRGRCEERYA